MKDTKTILAGQKKFFESGKTKDISFRAEQLNRLQSVIRISQKNILNALKQDLSKSIYEGYMTEVGIVLDESG